LPKKRTWYVAKEASNNRYARCTSLDAFPDSSGHAVVESLIEGAFWYGVAILGYRDDVFQRYVFCVNTL
jgi:hypothetical protein